MKILNTLLFVLIANTAFSQSEKFNIGVQLNPILHYNDVTVSDKQLGHMKPINVGFQGGVEVNYNITPKWTIAPTFKYFTKSQKIESKEFLGYFNEESFQRRTYRFESFCFGAILKYKMKNFMPSIGALYSIENHNSFNWSYHLYGDNPKTVHLGSYGWLYTPNDIGLKQTNFYALIGLRKTSKIKKIGTFEYGFVAYLPLKKMPAYTFDQIFITSDQGEVTTSVNYSSRQYSMECSIIYYLFNYNKKLHRTYPRKN